MQFFLIRISCKIEAGPKELRADMGSPHDGPEANTLTKESFTFQYTRRGGSGFGIWRLGDGLGSGREKWLNAIFSNKDFL